MKFYNQAFKYNVLRLPDVKAATGLSRSSIYKRISEDSFPKSINLGGRCVGWLQSDVENWIKQCLAASRMEGWSMNNRDQQRQFLIDKHIEKAGLRGKLNAKCIECIYDPYQIGTWRKQVENCTCLACPLYGVRPKQVEPCHGDVLLEIANARRRQ